MPTRALAPAALLAACLAACAQDHSTPTPPPTPPPAVAADSESPAPTWAATLADDGTTRVTIDGSPLLTSAHHFWSANWQYAWNESALQPADPARPGVVAAAGRAPDLELAWRTEMTRSAPDSAAPGMTLTYTLTGPRPLSGIVGGGLEFIFNPALLPGASTPQLLPSNTGFRWPTPRGELRVEFTPPLPEVYFERGNTSVIRCKLVADTRPAGTTTHRVNITLPPGTLLAPTLAERYAPPGPSWLPDTMPWDAWPIDLSHLNHTPAGSRGRVRADGERLVFADGSEARFWGCNVQAYALFYGSDDDIARQARRIAALGFNLVRIHHHDSTWVDPNVFGSGNALPPGTLDEAALARIDLWAAKLREQGVYLWLDLHVGRGFRPDENIPGYDELARQNAQGKGFNFVNDRIDQLMRTFARQYLTRTNRFTGLRYIDDPAVLAVLVTNENDLTHHFGNMMLPDKNNPYHHRLFERRVRDTARAMNLSFDDAFRTWEPGASKLVLNQLEADFFDRAIADLRAAGYPGLVAAGNYWGNMGTHGLASLTRGDLIDVHSYGVVDALSIDPAAGAAWPHWIGCASVLGLPLTISEWNVEWPIRDRFTAPMWMAALSCLQGWDAPMLYGYSQVSVQPPGSPDKWSAWIDPALMAQMPAAALAFRRADFDPARRTAIYAPSRDDLYFRPATPDTTPALRTFLETHAFRLALPDTPELTLDDALPRTHSSPDPSKNVIFVTDPDAAPAPPTPGVVESDTTQIRRLWRDGRLELRSPRTQAAVGTLAGARVELGTLAVELTTPAAAITATSLDDRALPESNLILLTIVAQAADGTPHGGVTIAEPVCGHLDLALASASNPDRPLEAIPLSPAGRELPPLRTSQPAPGILRVHLDELLRTHWVLVRPV